MKLYVAFSIHGTSTFIIATKTLEKMSDLENLEGFTEIPSRRPNYSKEKDGIKLNWTGLLSKQTGKPLRSPGTILQRFKQLEADGWSVEKTSFVKKHFQGRLKQIPF